MAIRQDTKDAIKFGIIDGARLGILIPFALSFSKAAQNPSFANTVFPLAAVAAFRLATSSLFKLNETSVKTLRRRRGKTLKAAGVAAICLIGGATVPAITAQPTQQPTLQ